MSLYFDLHSQETAQLMKMLFLVSERNFYFRNPDDGTSTLVESYGSVAVYNIANQQAGLRAQRGPVSTLDQPDAYRIFCEECQFPNTKWLVTATGDT